MRKALKFYPVLVNKYWSLCFSHGRKFVWLFARAKRKGPPLSGNRHLLKKKENFVGFLPSKKETYKQARQWISLRWAIITGKATFQSFYVFYKSRERSLNRKLISKVSSLFLITRSCLSVTRIESLSFYTATNPVNWFFLCRWRELNPAIIHIVKASFFYPWSRFHGNIIDIVLYAVLLFNVKIRVAQRLFPIFW